MNANECNAQQNVLFETKYKYLLLFFYYKEYATAMQWVRIGKLDCLFFSTYWSMLDICLHEFAGQRSTSTIVLWDEMCM